jgi:hypothetical protein
MNHNSNCATGDQIPLQASVLPLHPDLDVELIKFKKLIFEYVKQYYLLNEQAARLNEQAAQFNKQLITKVIN